MSCTREESKPSVTLSRITGNRISISIWFLLTSGWPGKCLLSAVETADNTAITEADHESNEWTRTQAHGEASALQSVTSFYEFAAKAGIQITHGTSHRLPT